MAAARDMRSLESASTISRSCRPPAIYSRERPRVSARARCLSLWPKRLPAEAEESALTSIPRRPPTIRQSGYLGKEHNDAASVASESHEAFIDNDSSIDIVGERRADRREGRLARGGSIENRDQNHRIDPSTGAASICRRSYWPMSPTGASIPSGHPFAGLYLPKARAAQSPDFKRSMLDCSGRVPRAPDPPQSLRTAFPLWHSGPPAQRQLRRAPTGPRR